MGNIMEFLKGNFMHVAPIFVVGGIAIAIVFERVRALLWTYPMSAPTQFFDKLRDLIMADRMAEAIAFCDRYPSKIVPSVVREALLRAHQPEAMIYDGLELAVSEGTQKVQKR